MWVFVQWHLDTFHAVDGNYSQECPLPSSAVLGVISIHEENQMYRENARKYVKKIIVSYY